MAGILLICWRTIIVWLNLQPDWTAPKNIVIQINQLFCKGKNVLLRLLCTHFLDLHFYSYWFLIYTITLRLEGANGLTKALKIPKQHCYNIRQYLLFGYITILSYHTILLGIIVVRKSSLRDWMWWLSITAYEMPQVDNNFEKYGVWKCFKDLQFLHWSFSN